MPKKITITRFITVAAVQKNVKKECAWFGEEGAFEPFPNGDTDVNCFFDNDLELVAIFGLHDDEKFFGKNEARNGCDKLLKGPFARKGRLFKLIAAYGGEEDSKMFWSGDARDIPKNLVEPFRKLIAVPKAVVIWKQMRTTNWVVSSANELEEAISTADSEDYEDFVGVF